MTQKCRARCWPKLGEPHMAKSAHRLINDHNFQIYYETALHQHILRRIHGLQSRTISTDACMGHEVSGERDMYGGPRTISEMINFSNCSLNISTTLIHFYIHLPKLRQKFPRPQITPEITVIQTQVLKSRIR